MRPPALFELRPDLIVEVPWLPLASAPTPVHALREFGRLVGGARLYAKREDLTDDDGYGGNKVRNLEFLLGDAVARGARRIVTVAPRGSNFVAALAAQAPRMGLSVEVAQFAPAHSHQIDAHAAFAAAQGARLTTWRGRLGALPAALAAVFARARGGSGVYPITPGGSSVMGTLGPMNAALELAAQVARGEAPAPDAVVVGVGTCGTMAGLLAGFALAGLSTRVIGIRCVDRLICRCERVARLANAMLARVGEAARFRARDVDLRDGWNDHGYGRASAAAAKAIESLRATEGIHLDTTYTSKVVAALADFARPGCELAGRTVLYWHTYSPAAMRWAEGQNGDKPWRSLPPAPASHRPPPALPPSLPPPPPASRARSTIDSRASSASAFTDGAYIASTRVGRQ
ncbi:MAG: pyridoxal-phosphate dependent enzyme [Planctomycetes bacterium]|nr:pyridoxal-phosphate dependent enzyme [Planctomycetota bacterium]